MREKFNPIRLLPGLLLAGGVTLGAMALAEVEERLFGRAYLEALVLAILLGTLIRSCWMPGRRWAAGIAFAQKPLLELAVMLLGASVGLEAILGIGPALLLGIVAIVLVAIILSYLLGRAMGLPQRIAILIACGNSICGNSAIAAVAPVIHADSDDVAASIAFTAVLGVAVVLLLPLLIPLVGLSMTQYGVLAGLTVYAVPQIFAATATAGLVGAQIGMLVKLTRVLMLGPVVLALSLAAARFQPVDANVGRRAVPLHRLVPWFVVGFLALACLRSAHLIPAVLLDPTATLARFLTILAMAALGLGVDIRVVAKAGGRVSSAVIASLLVLIAISLCLIRALGVA